MKEGKNTIRDVQPEISWLYGNAAKRGILKQITRLLWGESGHIFFVLSIYNKWWFAPYYKPYIYKKNGRAFAYPQARESKPYVHKQETPPAYREGTEKVPI